MGENDSLQLLHKLELKIALEIKRVCEKHGINYFLTAGSLLGAVRHHGFIPWDDDLDIGMPRADYEKFVSIFNEETNPEIFFMENWNTEKEFGLTFTKIKLQNTKFVEYSISETQTHKGIFVDVFPYDAIPNDEDSIKRLAKKVFLLGKIFKFRQGYLPTNPDDKKQLFICKIVGGISQILPLTKIQEWLYKTETQYNGTNNRWVAFVSSAYNLRDYFEKECLDEFIPVEFEGETFAIPSLYDIVLKRIYGDYMQLPPVEKRVFRHNSVLLDFGPYSELDN